MSFVSDLFSGLTGFRDHLITTAEEAAAPVLAAVESHLARLEPLVRNNILAAEDEGRAILHELYGKVVTEVKQEAETPAEPAPAPAPEPTETSTVAEPAPATPSADAVPEAATVDPTPAPSTTEAASSTPSSETSTASSAATTDATPAASA